MQRVTASDAQSQADRLVVAGRASLVAEATEAALHVTPLPHCGTNTIIMYTFLHSKCRSSQYMCLLLKRVNNFTTVSRLPLRTTKPIEKRIARITGTTMAATVGADTIKRDVDNDT